ncbi:MAG: hypothetical protein ACJAYU_003926 [Bradymonadia bacterium]
MVHADNGAAPPVGDPCDRENQTLSFDAPATGQYWYFRIVSTFNVDRLLLYDIDLFSFTGVCSGDCDLDTDGDGVVDCYDLASGDVVVTEIMRDPEAVGDAAGDWIELHNPSSSDINFDGATLMDADGDSVPFSDLEIPAGAYVVLAAESDQGRNGDVVTAYEYGTGLPLDQLTGDEVILTTVLGVELGRVEFDDGTAWPNTAGASMKFGGDALDDNNSPVQ